MKEMLHMNELETIEQKEGDVKYVQYQWKLLQLVNDSNRKGFRVTNFSKFILKNIKYNLLWTPWGRRLQTFQLM